MNQYGDYVIQHLLEHGAKQYHHRIAMMLLSKMTTTCLQTNTLATLWLMRRHIAINQIDVWLHTGLAVCPKDVGKGATFPIIARIQSEHASSCLNVHHPVCNSTSKACGKSHAPRCRLLL